MKFQERYTEGFFNLYDQFHEHRMINEKLGILIIYGMLPFLTVSRHILFLQLCRKLGVQQFQGLQQSYYRNRNTMFPSERSDKSVEFILLMISIMSTFAAAFYVAEMKELWFTLREFQIYFTLKIHQVSSFLVFYELVDFLLFFSDFIQCYI